MARKVPTKRALKAVIFDLDDTLYDHLHSARHGLAKLAKRYPAMQSASIRELEDRYSVALETVHLRLLHGEIDQTTARIVRMQQLFSSFGITVDTEVALTEYKKFRADYDSACQMVAGGREVLDRLKEMGLRLAIITNNLVSEQWPKLEQLEIAHYFEVVSISEEVGSPKPAPKIFDVTLQRLSLSVDQVVMVGDSVSSDIAGATAVGMRAVWLNRRPELNVSAPSGVAAIDRDFADVSAAIGTIASIS